jgi:hypothetical protein
MGIGQNILRDIKEDGGLIAGPTVQEIFKKLEMSKLETCHHCGEEKENCYHGYIAMTIPIPEAEEKIEKWNLINAYRNYCEESKTKEIWNEDGTMTAISPVSHYTFLVQEEFINNVKTDPEFSKKWYTKTWWKNLERTDLNEEEFYELDSIATYDQLLNTVGRGVQCDDCGKKEAELYEKYYPKSLEVK